MPDSTRPAIFDYASAKIIAEEMRKLRGRLPPKGQVVRRNDVQASYKCKLASSLSSGSFAYPASCQVNAWVLDSGGGPALVASSETELTGISATSYLKLLTSAPSGTQARIEWGDCGWEIVWVEWC